MTEERVLKAIADEGLTPSATSLAEFYRQGATRTGGNQAGTLRLAPAPAEGAKGNGEMDALIRCDEERSRNTTKLEGRSAGCTIVAAAS